MEAFLTRYEFDTQGEDHWHAIQRLCAEVDWAFDDAPDSIVSALSARTERVRASRAATTRKDFIASLCTNAGLSVQSIDPKESR